MKRELNIDLDGVLTKLGKFSNNLEKHGNEDVSCWALPCANIPVDKDQQNELMQDAHFTRSVWNNNKGLFEPMPWLRNVEINYTPTFEEASVQIAFEEDQEPQEFEKCRIKITAWALGTNGISICTLQIQVYPNRKQKILIDEHQNRDVRIWISNSKLSSKKNSKQSDMFKPAEKEAEAPSVGTTPLTGSHIKQPSGSESESPSEPTTSDGSTEGSSDAKGESPSQSETPSEPETTDGKKADDTQEFAEGAARALGTHMSKSRRGVVDGRSRNRKH